MLTLLVDNPIEGVWCSGVGLLAPFDLIRLVVLSIVPGMVSLRVWGNVRLAVLNWIDHSLSKRSQRGIISFDFLFGSDGRVKIISSNRGNMCLPFSLISLISLIVSPGIVSLIVGRDLGLSIVVLNVLPLGKSSSSWVESGV